MNKQRLAIILSGVVLFFIMLLINILQIGGRGLITWVNNLTMLVFLVFAAGQALTYWRSLQNRKEATQVWLILGLGLAFYALGQLTWIVYNLSGVEVPYPSLGDLFWLFAYPLLVTAVVNKNLLLGVLPDGRQITVVTVLGLILFLLMGDFILAPMLVYAENARTLETVLNFFYPIMDFLILAAVSFLVIALWKGRLSLTWNIIAAGFVVLAIADVFFIYATWNESYYADGNSVNLLTRIVDVAYALSPFLLALGVYLDQWVSTVQPDTVEFEFSRSMRLGQPRPQQPSLNPEMQAIFDKIYLMVDNDQRVYYFSQYYRELCKMAGDISGHTVGTPLHSVLGMERHTIEGICSDILFSREKVVQTEILVGVYRIPATLRVHPARNGFDVFMRYRHKGTPLVVEEQKSVERILVDEAIRSVEGIENASIEVKGALAFFIIEVQEMYLFLVRMGGYRVGQVLVEKFNQMAAGTNAGIRIVDGRVVVTNLPSTQIMSNLLQLTLKTVQGLTSSESTSEVVKLLSKRIPEGIIHSAQNAGLAL